MFRKRHLLTRPLLTFMGAMVLANIASRMYGPLLALYLESMGADVGQVGLFFTLSSIAPLAFQILGGWLSDSIGRLQAVAIGSVAGVVGMLVYIVAPTWQWMLLSSLASAVAVAFVAPSFQAFIAEQSNEENLGEIYGLAESIFMIVGIVGPPLGGFLADQFGFRTMFIVAAALYTCATGVRLWMARNARRSESGAKRQAPSFRALRTDLGLMVGMVLGGGVLTWILISDGVRDVTYRMAFEMQSLYLQNFIGINKTQIGWLMSMSSIVTALLMSSAGRLSDRRGERVGIVGGFAIVAAGLVVFLNSSGFFGCAVAWILFGIGSALIGPAYNSLISKVVPQKLRGTAFGLFSTSLSFISLPAPYIGGLLWQRFGPKVPFYAPVIATILVLPVMWVKFKLPSKESKESRESKSSPNPALKAQPAAVATD